MTAQPSIASACPRGPDVDAALAIVRDAVPGLVRCAVVVLPDGDLLGGHGGADQLDYEPLVRAARRCLAERPTPTFAGGVAPFAEYLLASPDGLVVVQAPRGSSRVALVVACTREPNVAFVLAATRKATRALERALDLAAWGLG